MNKIFFCLLPFLLVFQYEARGQGTNFSNQIEQYVRPYVESNNFSGVILISQKGQILFHKAFGAANLEFAAPNNLTTAFHVASLSKIFTATAILLLEQKGLLSTQDFLSKYIPDYPSGDKITLHHLLSHTSGITDINDLPAYQVASLQPQTPETLVALFKNQPLEFLPGEKFQYTSSNYHVLALIIEQVSKKTYGDFLNKNIFAPLGMNQTFHHAKMTQVVPNMAEGYDPDGRFGLQKAPYLDWSAKVGGGSLVSTAADLQKWNQALFGNAILSDQSKIKMFTDYGGAGYGWYVGKQFDKRYIYMNGRTPGFCAHIGRYPEEDINVVVLSNVNVFLPKRMSIDMAGILFHQPVAIPSLNRPLTQEESSQLPGKYQFDKTFYKSNFTMEVTLRDGRLISNYGELVPDQLFQFYQRSYWLKVSFTRDAGGKIDGITVDGFRGVKIQ